MLSKKAAKKADAAATSRELKWLRHAVRRAVERVCACRRRLPPPPHPPPPPPPPPPALVSRRCSLLMLAGSGRRDGEHQHPAAAAAGWGAAAGAGCAAAGGAGCAGLGGRGAPLARAASAGQSAGAHWAVQRRGRPSAPAEHGDHLLIHPVRTCERIDSLDSSTRPVVCFCLPRSLVLMGGLLCRNLSLSDIDLGQSVQSTDSDSLANYSSDLELPAPVAVASAPFSNAESSANSAANTNGGGLVTVGTVGTGTPGAPGTGGGPPRLQGGVGGPGNDTAGPKRWLHSLWSGLGAPRSMFTATAADGQPAPADIDLVLSRLLAQRAGLERQFLQLSTSRDASAA